MPKALRTVCALHLGLAVLNVLWTGLIAWWLGRTLLQAAPVPWSAYRGYERLIGLFGPLLLVMSATGVALNGRLPDWIRRHERHSVCCGLAWMNLVPVFSFFGIGLPVALYALAVYRRKEVRAWLDGSETIESGDSFADAFEPHATACDLPPVPDSSTRVASATAVGITAGAARRRTTQLLAEVVR